MKVSIIIPSRDRPEGLQRVIDSIQATTGDYEVEIVVVLDAADTTTQALMKARYPDMLVVVGGPGDAYLGRPQEKYNLGYAVCTGDWIVTGADDITFDTPGWLDACLRVNRGGFVGLPDGGQDPQWVCVLVLASRTYIETVMRGYLGLPWYHVWWADVEWAARARQAGVYTWCKLPHLLTHHHWLASGSRAGDGAKDRIYALAQTLVAEDEVTYTRRAQTGFSRDEAAAVIQGVL